MECKKLYPLLLEPHYKDYVWGGKRIGVLYNRSSAPAMCAESWEASGRDQTASLILNGEFKGSFLNNLVKTYPTLLGPHFKEHFPLLFKLIDANEALSIQVHPHQQAIENGIGEAKSEMWYIIDANPGSKIYLGLKKNLQNQELVEVINEGRLEEEMNAIEVQTGEAYYIPAGLIHSIGKGCLIYEVQQNSDTTYRLYDWHRKNRPLHIEQALSVMLANQVAHAAVPVKKVLKNDQIEILNILNCPFFSVRKLKLNTSFILQKELSFRVYFLLSGKLTLKFDKTTLSLEPGQTFLLPADIEVEAVNTHSFPSVLLETIPKECELI